MRQTRRKAFSLVEMMVSLALVGMMMTSLAIIVQSAVRYYTTSNLVSEVEQATLTASTSLTIDLCESTLASVGPTAYGPTTWMVMASPRQEYSTVGFQYWTNGAGQLQLFWESLVGYYVDGTGKLVRKIKPITASQNPPTPTTPAYVPFYNSTYFASFATSDYRVVSADIAYFELAPDPASNALMWLGVYGQDPGGVFQLSVVTRVSPRN